VRRPGGLVPSGVSGVRHLGKLETGGDLVPVSERLDALDLMAALVLEDGSRRGEKAAPFQWADATAVLDVESATPYHFLTRSRGGSKTADLAGMAVAAMLTQLPAGSRLYALAADRDQGRLLLDSVQGYRERTPMLRNALDVGAYRVTATRGGSTLDVLAADAPGAWGLRPAFLIVDELAQWPATTAARRLWEAGMTAMHKVPGSRLAVLTSAGDPAHWSHKLLEHARSDRLWRVHEVDGPPPWTVEERLEEQRRQLPESSFRQRYLNEWVEAEDRLTSRDDLAACVTLDGPLPVQTGKTYVIGLDIGLKHDRTVAAVAISTSRATTGSTTTVRPGGTSTAPHSEPPSSSTGCRRGRGGPGVPSS
jgi:phage terminase large subunit-like protein